jgi:amidase
LDVEITVDVIPGRAVPAPRLETAEELVAVGIGGSLDAALANATTQLARWLEQEYGVSSTDAALLLGQAVRYDIAEVVGRSRVIGAAVKKDLVRAKP